MYCKYVKGVVRIGNDVSGSVEVLFCFEKVKICTENTHEKRNCKELYGLERIYTGV